MTTREVSPHEPHARERREAARLVRRIQTLFLEVEELRRREERNPELRAKERTLEQLHWRGGGRATLRTRRPGRCRVTIAASTFARTAGPFGS